MPVHPAHIPLARAPMYPPNFDAPPPAPQPPPVYFLFDHIPPSAAGPSSSAPEEEEEPTAKKEGCMTPQAMQGLAEGERGTEGLTGSPTT
eukprot:scaffold8436_cov135-Isochrysis_galbana.AAC.3